ncbi:MAG: DUF120 domain-containing protein [Candidatus Woesearchaeota archaeon]
MIYEILKTIAKKGIYSEINISTTKLSNELKLSQQSISRYLINMDQEKLINRKTSNKGITLSLTEKGINFLKKEHNELSNILKPKQKIEGKIVNGIGQGSYYVKIYSDKIKEIINFKPFHGTLNLKVNKSDFEKFISDLKPHTIKEFKSDERTFGELIIYEIKINKTKAGLLLPKRTIHPQEIIEIISPYNLRNKFNLNENDIIKLEK